MAAGLGFKTFTTGEVLTAADTNGYLMQGVLVFASAAARDAAITSPQEGQFAYLKDTNVTTYYTGSAWANLDTTGMTNPMTTTGDTIYSSSGSTPARLGIGTTGQVLTVAGGVPSWAAPAAGGGFTQLASTTPSGATTSFTTISGSYKHLCLIFQDVYASSDNQALSLTLNSISTSTYSYARLFDSATTYGSSNAYATTSIAMAGVTASATATDKAVGVIWFYNYATSGSKSVDWKLVYNRSTAGSFFVMGEGFNTTASAISQIDLTVGAGTFSGGTMTLYGVN